MPHYKLTYFNLNAVAEPIRWLFKLAKVDFEDERIEMADWPKLKESGRFPMGQLPILEMDGEVHSQSGALLKYLAKRYGFITGNDKLNLIAEEVHDIVDDCVTAFRQYRSAEEGEKKEAVKENMVTNTLPKAFKEIERIMTSTEGPYVVGHKVTYADLVLANYFQICTAAVEPTLKDTFPTIAKHAETVLNLPDIKSWVAKRPKAMF